jgi:hypothetical protein
MTEKPVFNQEGKQAGQKLAKKFAKARMSH